MDPKFPIPNSDPISKDKTLAEKDLRGHVSEERRLEMEKYGRTKIYDQVAEYLQGDRQGAFSLVNHALAVIDDQIDNDSNIEHLNKAKAILNKGFRGEATELTEAWEKDIFKLGQTLSRLSGDGFSEAKEVFDEVVNYWEIEKQNLDRKGKALGSPDLDDLNLKIGKSIGLQFLALLCPGLDKESKESIAASYGLAIKLADNLSDLSEDLAQGYINIPKEGIEKYGLDVSDLNQGDLLSYKKTELERIKQYYEEADKLVKVAIEHHPQQEKGLSIFRDIAHSWLKQAEEVCFVEDLRQFDIADHPTPKFLSKTALLEMEGVYGIGLSDIIALSYEQEARNTHLVREKDPSYNPYSHEKTPQANEEIRELIGKCPAIQDVLDLGCDDGSRTTELFKGKTLHGMESVAEATEEARKKGVLAYQGSMISDVYKDPAHLNGREFDLVSITGEMVNFVGLDTDVLLANAVKQTKDKGYVLVSCMHSKFDEAQEGNFVVWSFTESTKDKWKLGETKIPRTFAPISKQGLAKRMEDASQQQNCHLMLKEEKSIDNYYGDMQLGIYIFQKI
ncbi:MAG: hypothetical protein PHC53_01580 [Patescibacteria group bacterium]|nr:hypothetical protein [Patescibacteria group bacterium]